MKDVGILKLLCETVGVTGHEKNIAVIVKNIFEKYCNEVITDDFSNVIGVMKARVRDNTSAEPLKIMYAAHIDEIGMIVKKIESGGFIKIGKISGVDPKILVSKKVIIHAGGEPIKGIVASVPPHLTSSDDRKKALTFEDLYVDTGMSEEKVKERITVGDIVSFSSSFETHGLHMVSGKSMDDRAGVFALIKAMQMLKDKSFSYDLIFLASVSEEFNSLGATAGAYRVQPDITIVVDGTHGKAGSAEISEDKQIFSLGKGPVICKSPILSTKLTNGIIEICRNQGLKPLIEVDNKNTGTDAFAVSVAGSGCAAALLSIPVKYMHTQVEMVNLSDIEITSQVMSGIALQNSVIVRGYI